MCCDSWGRKESDTTERLNWTELNCTGASDSKESTCNERNLGLIPGSGRSPGGGHSNPLQYSCLENLHGQSSLEGYSSWGHKKLDMME